MNRLVPVDAVRYFTCAGFIAGIALSLQLWVNQRLFPLAPVIPGAVLPTPFDYTLLGLLVIGLIAAFLTPNRLFIRITLGVLALILLQDQMRWQPWVYTYVLMLIPFSFPLITDNKKQADKIGENPHLVYIQLFLIGMYWWSGVHKLNANFVEVIYPLFVKALFKVQEGHWLYEAKALGYIIPLTEILVGIGLAFPRTRRWATIGAIGTHVMIVIYLSPLGLNDNHVVIPWNLAMIGIVFFACFRQKNRISLLAPMPNITWRWAKWAVIVLVWLLPALHLRKQWDTYLSFDLYSENIDHLYIALRQQALAQLGDQLSAYYTPQNLIEEGKVVDVTDWSFKELNVPVYPEKRVFKAIARHFCALGLPDDQIMFVEYKRPFTAGKYRTYDCSFSGSGR